MSDNSEVPPEILSVVEALRSDLKKLTAELPFEAESALTFHPDPESGE